MAELDALRKSHQQLDVDLLVANEAVTEGREIVQQLERQLFRVQQDLAQYQGALSPNAMVPGLRIQAFELHATEQPNRYRFKVMVTRVGEDSDSVQATLQLSVHGQQNGKAVVLPLSDLATDLPEDAMALNFRYFQVVPPTAGVAALVLPEDFEPQRVTLKAVEGADVLVEQSFDWIVIGARP